MTKLPVVSGSDIVKVLSKTGFVHVRTSGSHAILKRKDETGEKIVPVPLHRELAKGTLLSIISQAGISRDDLMRLLK